MIKLPNSATGSVHSIEDPLDCWKYKGDKDIHNVNDPMLDHGGLLTGRQSRKHHVSDEAVTRNLSNHITSFPQLCRIADSHSDFTHGTWETGFQGVGNITERAHKF